MSQSACCDLHVAPALPWALGVGHCQGGAANVLQEIRKPHIELAVWQRQLPDDLADLLQDGPPPAVSSLRALANVRNAGTALSQALQGKAPVNARHLIDDVVMLVCQFADLSGVDLVDLRLQRLADDGCTRWHRDFANAADHHVLRAGHRVRHRSVRGIGARAPGRLCRSVAWSGHRCGCDRPPPADRCKFVLIGRDMPKDVLLGGHAQCVASIRSLAKPKQ
jgi:hypothetical protein